MAAMNDLRQLTRDSDAWPFVEARKILDRHGGVPPAKGHVLLETGYGPSGLPHIGTFAEVARTTMILHAFRMLSDVPAKLVCFSDDMDGLRKVPDNVPNRELLAQHLGKPLTSVPDPFGTHPSFGEHNNARLRAFLDQFGFEYEALSATQCYRSGRFDAALLEVLRHHDEIRDVILPTLGEERRRTYSPFLPISPTTGRVLQVPVLDRDPEAGTITFEDEDGERRAVAVTGGRVKCQWKVDWAMRWYALDVDYEMSGKDLMESVKLSSMVQRLLGGRPPESLTYELFLDEKGEKISKSKGNGLTIEEWLAYANPESLSWYMYQSPRRAKRLYFDVIPRAVDDYYAALESFPEQPPQEKLRSAVFHIHDGDPPRPDVPVTYSVLLNIVSGAHVTEKERLWGFVRRYRPDATPENHPELDRLIGYAIRYYHDFVAPSQSHRAPNEQEAAGMARLVERLRALPPTASPETIQYECYEAGKDVGFTNLRAWFQSIYECLLGHSQGPRMGSFVAVYGIDATIDLLESAIAARSRVS
jgi:lysyl-tRNA synthetase class 1